MMTMMAGAVVAPSLPQIASVFIDTEHIELLSRLVITLPALFIAIFSPFFGSWSDKYGRKNLLLFSLVLYAFGGTSGYFLNNIYYILIGRVVLGISVAGIMTIATALIGDYFKGDERNGFVGMQGAFMGFGGVVFISIAGWFADIHWHAPFLIYLFAVPVLILGLVYLYEPEKVIPKDKSKAIDLNYNKQTAVLIYILAFIGIVFFYMIPVQIPFLLSGMEGVSNSGIGIAISTSTFTSALTSISYKRIKRYLSFKNIYQLTFLFMALGYLIISQVDSYSLILVGLAVSGIGTGLLMPTGNLWIMSIAPNNIRGTLVGKLAQATFLGMFLSPFLLQPIINQKSVSFLFLTATFIMGLIAFVLFLLKKK